MFDIDWHQGQGTVGADFGPSSVFREFNIKSCQLCLETKLLNAAVKLSVYL